MSPRVLTRVYPANSPAYDASIDVERCDVIGHIIHAKDQDSVTVYKRRSQLDGGEEGTLFVVLSIADDGRGLCRNRHIPYVRGDALLHVVVTHGQQDMYDEAYLDYTRVITSTDMADRMVAAWSAHRVAVWRTDAAELDLAGELHRVCEEAVTETAMTAALRAAMGPSGCGAGECSNCRQEFPDRVLRRCSACKSVSYCSAECQRAHWRAGGHKAACGM